MYLHLHVILNIYKFLLINQGEANKLLVFILTAGPDTYKQIVSIGLQLHGFQSS